MKFKLNLHKEKSYQYESFVVDKSNYFYQEQFRSLKCLCTRTWSNQIQIPDDRNQLGISVDQFELVRDTRSLWSSICGFRVNQDINYQPFPITRFISMVNVEYREFCNAKKKKNQKRKFKIVTVNRFLQFRVRFILQKNCNSRFFLFSFFFR